MTKKPLYLRLDSEKHHQLTVIADNVNLSLNQLFDKITDLILQGNINITNNGIYLHNDSSDSISAKSDCTYQDINNQIDSLKSNLLNKQISVDNQINLLTERLDKLEQDNDSLKQENINIDNELRLIKDNQDKLSDKLINSENNNDDGIEDILPMNEGVKISESDSIILDSKDSKYQNYALMTIAQLHNEFDSRAASYPKKANKSKLIELLSNLP